MLQAAEVRERLLRALDVPAGATSDFDQNGSVPAGLEARPAGVLAAFHEDGRLLLTKRASGLRHHPGQIALPGGKVDPGDADEIAAALREARSAFMAVLDGYSLESLVADRQRGLRELLESFGTLEPPAQAA